MRKIVGIVAGVVAVSGIIIFSVRGGEEARLREIISRAIKAHGGAEKLEKLKSSSLKSKGKFHSLGGTLDYSGDTYIQLPNRFRTDVQSKFGEHALKLSQAVEGDKGWFKLNELTADLDRNMLLEVREQVHLAVVTHLTTLSDKHYKLSPLGEAQVGDRPAVGIHVERKGYRDVNLYFDRETNLLIKVETRGKDLMRGGEEFTAETLYDDYKTVDGLMAAHKITIKRDGQLFVEADVQEVTFAEQLDDKLFEKP